MSKKSIQDIARVLAEKYELEAKDAENFVDAMFDTIKTGVEQEGIIKIKGLGTFKIIDVNARESVNINTGERVLIESHGKITFTPDNTMKELVNKPFSQFETVLLNDGIAFDDIESNKQNDMNEPESPMMADEKEKLRFQSESAHDTETGPVSNETDEKEEQGSGKCFLQEKENVISSELESKDSVPSEDTFDMETIQNNNEEIDWDGDGSYEHGSHNKRKWGLVCIFSIIMMGLSAYAGYLYGLYTVKEELDVHSHTGSVIEKPHKTIIIKRIIKESSNVANNDSVKSAVDKNVREADAINKPDTVDWAKYEKMDNSVRTGAYRIIGTERIWTVRKGETLDDISRRVLGDGMSCYIEVYNALSRDSELKEGQKIKIPKLELKKRRRNKQV